LAISIDASAVCAGLQQQEDYPGIAFSSRIVQWCGPVVIPGIDVRTLREELSHALDIAFCDGFV
jgi:hypothetical protein